MKSKRKLLEFVRTGIFSNHLDAYEGVNIGVRKLYRIYAEGYPYRQNATIVELTNSSGVGHRLGYKSNKELIDCYCKYMFVKDWGEIPKYTTYNKNLRYR